MIARLHADSWRSTYRGILRDAFLDGDVLHDREVTWAERLASARDDQCVIVCTAEGGLCGFVCAYGKYDPELGTLVDNLHVAASRRGTRIGTALLREAALWAEARYPSEAVYLWVMAANQRARGFYERRAGRSREAVLRENPGGGLGMQLRYVWPSAAELAAACAAPEAA